MKFLKWLGIIVGGLVGLFIIMAVIGMMMGLDKEPQKVAQINPAQETQKAETPKEAQPVKAPEKTLGQFNRVDQAILALLHKGGIKTDIADSPMPDGTPRRMYSTESATIEVYGNPSVSKTSVTMIPSKNAVDNMTAMVLIMAALSSSCTLGDTEENGKFMKITNDFLGSKKTKQTGTIGFCIYEMNQMKGLPIWPFTFTPK